MSQIPPGQSDGWIDPNGHLQPGFPPPGYWQASDGRWYPPDAASADTQVVNPSAHQQFTPPTPAPVDPASPSTYPPHGAPPAGPPSYGAAQPSFDPPSGPPNYEPQAGGAPQYAPQAAAPGPYGSPPAGFAPPAAPKKSRTGLFVVLGVVALAVAGCTGIGVVALARSGDSNNIAGDTSSTTAVDDAQTSTSAEGATSTDSDESGTTETTARTLAGVTTAPGAGSIGDGSGCEIIDDSTIRVELVNDSPATQSFFLTVGFFDGETRLGDTVAIVGNLRPGERTIEDTFYFDQSGSRCEILEADGFEVSYDADALADVSPCEITGVDSFGDIESELSVTNSGSGTADYSVQLSFVDDGGIRRGTGFANVESVRAGETAPSDVFTVVEAADGLVCEVVGVDRTDS